MFPTLDDTQPIIIPIPRPRRRPLGTYIISYGCGDHYWRCDTAMTDGYARKRLDWWAARHPNTHFVLRWHGMFIDDARVIA